MGGAAGPCPKNRAERIAAVRHPVDIVSEAANHQRDKIAGNGIILGNEDPRDNLRRAAEAAGFVRFAGISHCHQRSLARTALRSR